ncbi:hypothetical protein N7481_001170 [Penicillium waksmanii]|uniref:uncharacterized protein n=1 Tax=Penicillium waksmanii TaxID=69791 RepID=UPI002546A777|nr:uncharacterized protein N7481_001170 [Penicillium waksmanii]KAJ6000761.1 hypothetical protein N7481_001170 [Penicillium waksmanii]
MKEREEAAAGTAGSGTAPASGPGSGYGFDIASLVGFTGIVFGVICLTEYVWGHGPAGGGPRKDSDSKE